MANIAESQAEAKDTSLLAETIAVMYYNALDMQ